MMSSLFVVDADSIGKETLFVITSPTVKGIS